MDGLWWALFVLGGFKLGCVVFIFRNTRVANTENWNDMAIDLRYLAERLRSSSYLARVGSFQPPASFGVIASRWMRQSPIDWYFDAITRHASPMGTSPYCQKPETGDGPCRIRIDNQDALRHLERHWLEEQLVYNVNNARKWNTVSHGLEHWVSRSSWGVIGLVVVDLAIAVAYTGGSPVLAKIHHVWTPWLIFGATLLPALIATAHGLRSKTEAPRLADRHRVMEARILERRDELRRLLSAIEAETDGAAKPRRARNADVLLLAEVIAQDFINEVADWSVIYDKEVPDL